MQSSRQKRVEAWFESDESEEWSGFVIHWLCVNDFPTEIMIPEVRLSI